MINRSEEEGAEVTRTGVNINVGMPNLEGEVEW